MVSPLLAGTPLTAILDSASRASSLSLESLVMTLTAASCSYNALLSSCRVCVKCCRRVWVSNASASHSFWKTDSNDGMEVRVGGRGRTVRDDLSSTRSSVARSSFVTGSLPCSEMYASMRRFSKIFPIRVSLTKIVGLFSAYHFLLKLRGLEELRQIL